MTLHIAKGRPATTYDLPLPALTAGVPWSFDVKVWNPDGTPASMLTAYDYAAIISVDGRGCYDAQAVATITIPEPGVIRVSFATTAFIDRWSDVYRFTLDVGIAGIMTQRLVDSRLPIMHNTGFAGRPLPVIDPIGPVPPPGGWPSGSNTGPVGTLVEMYGDILANVPGAVVENIRLAGSIRVTASDVTVRNCEINAAFATVGLDASGVDDFKADHVRVTGSGAFGMVVGNDAVVTACDVSGVVTGIRFYGAGAILQRNFIHALTGATVGLRSDGCSDVDITGNSIANGGAANLILKTDVGPISDVAFVSNMLSGAPTVNVVVDIGAGASVVEDVVIANNGGTIGTAGIADVDPAVAGEVSIHDNVLT